MYFSQRLKDFFLNQHWKKNSEEIYFIVKGVQSDIPRQRNWQFQYLSKNKSDIMATVFHKWKKLIKKQVNILCYRWSRKEDRIRDHDEFIWNVSAYWKIYCNLICYSVRHFDKWCTRKFPDKFLLLFKSQ